jgi:hypothetical protein
MSAAFVRDAAATAAVFGFFAASWFGWAQDDPPKPWRRPLIAGSILSLLTAVAGGLLTWRHWTDGTVFDADTSRTFGVVVGVLVTLAAVVAVPLARSRSLAVSAVTGLAAGTVLLAAALFSTASVLL